MKLARVAGTVVTPISVDVFQQRKLLLCDLLSERGEPLGSSLIAVDAIGAGAGETVLILDEGNSARQIIGRADAPVRALVVGIVDQIDLPARSDQTPSRKEVIAHDE